MVSDSAQDREWTVQVLTGSMFDKPLFETKGASKVVVRNADGIPAMAFVKISDSAWASSMATDEDWKSVCIRYGIK